MHDRESSEALALERMLFFSDAVFAIAITLLVIEIKMPELPHGAGERQLAFALANLIPIFVGFFISFFLIGQTWIEHHKMGRELQTFDLGLLWKNLLLLFFVAFMPFATVLLSEHFTTRLATVVYAATFTGLGLAKVSFWRHAVRRGLVIEGASASVYSIGRRVWAAPIAAAIVMVTAVAGVPFAPAGFALIPLIAALRDRPRRAPVAVRLPSEP